MTWITSWMHARSTVELKGARRWYIIQVYMYAPARRINVAYSGTIWIHEEPSSRQVVTQTLIATRPARITRNLRECIQFSILGRCIHRAHTHKDVFNPFDWDPFSLARMLAFHYITNDQMGGGTHCDVCSQVYPAPRQGSFSLPGVQPTGNAPRENINIYQLYLHDDDWEKYLVSNWF